MPDRLSWSNFDGPSPVHFLVEPNELCIPTADQTIQSTKSSTKFETIQIMQFDFMQCCAAGAGRTVAGWCAFDGFRLCEVSLWHAQDITVLYGKWANCLENISYFFVISITSMCECMCVCVSIHSLIRHRMAHNFVVNSKSIPPVSALHVNDQLETVAAKLNLWFQVNGRDEMVLQFREFLIGFLWWDHSCLTMANCVGMIGIGQWTNAIVVDQATFLNSALQSKQCIYTTNKPIIPLLHQTPLAHSHLPHSTEVMHTSHLHRTI